MARVTPHKSMNLIQKNRGLIDKQFLWLKRNNMKVIIKLFKTLCLEKPEPSVNESQLKTNSTAHQTEVGDSKPIVPSFKNAEIVIHVVDPNTNLKKDFVLNQKTLMVRMKFF